MNKKMNVSSVRNEIEEGSAFFRTPSQSKTLELTPQQRHKPSVTHPRKEASDIPRINSREVGREYSRKGQLEFPSRDDIQEFSFHLRDEHKVKVQAEVPYQWQDELDELARTLKVRKLELYRYIIGQFLGKTGDVEGKVQ